MRKAALYALAAPLLLCLVAHLQGVLEFVHARGWGSEGFGSGCPSKDWQATPQPTQASFPTITGGGGGAPV